MEKPANYRSTGCFYDFIILFFGSYANANQIAAINYALAKNMAANKNLATKPIYY